MKSKSLLHFRFTLTFFVNSFSVYQAKTITIWLFFLSRHVTKS